MRPTSLVPFALAAVLVGTAGFAAAQREILPPTPPTGVQAAVRDAFRAHLLAKRAEVEACHAETAARRGTALVTHLVFRVRVWPDGQTAVRIVDRTRVDRAFERCLLRALDGPRLPGHGDDRPRSILYDLVFATDGPRLPVEPRGTTAGDPSPSPAAGG